MYVHLVTSPASPSGSPPSYPYSEEPSHSEADDGDDDGGYIDNSNPSSAPRTRNRWQTHKQTTSLRRRPFLIFDKTQPKGYKKVERKAPVKTPPPSQYRPGDGFSGREAKPTGLNSLTRSGRQFAVGAMVGVLDLTQTAPQANQKRSAHRANREDNSFAPVPKAKRSRRLEPYRGDDEVPVRPPRLAAPAARNTDPGRAALREIPGNVNKTRPAAPVQKMDAKNTAHPRATAPAGASLPSKLEVPQANLPTDLHLDGTPVGIRDGDDARDGSSGQHTQRASQGRDTQEEVLDSWPTHISDTPPRQLRASSVPSDPSPRRDPPQFQARAFRRCNTQ